MKCKEIIISEWTLAKVKELEESIKQDPDKQKPVFYSKGLTVFTRVKDLSVFLKGKGRYKYRYKFIARGESGAGYDAVCWNAPTNEKPVKSMKVDLMYTPVINRWQGIETIQLNISDLTIAGERVESMFS